MQIRKAAEKDLGILAGFWYEEEKMHKKFDKTSVLRKDAKKKIYNFLKSNINKNNFAAFIAQFNGVIVGVIQGEIKKAYFTCNPALIGHCGTIFVKNEYRERGIATELFKSIVKWFKSKKVKTLSLYTHCKNNDAIDFWKNAGFKESMVLMKKVLR